MSARGYALHSVCSQLFFRPLPSGCGGLPNTCSEATVTGIHHKIYITWLILSRYMLCIQVFATTHTNQLSATATSSQLLNSSIM